LSAAGAARPGSRALVAVPPRLEAPGPRVHLEIATSLPALHGLRTEWERLEREVEQATVYQTWAWVVSWYEHFGQDKRLRLASARDEDGRLVAVVPLSSVRSLPVVGPRLLHFLGRGNRLTEYVDALVRPEHGSTVVRALFDVWDRHRRSWDLWTLPCAPAESVLPATLRECAGARRYAVVAEEHARVTLPLPATWDAFQAQLGRNMKKHLRKFANRLERDGKQPKLTAVSDPHELDGGLEALFDLHGRRARAELGRAHRERLADPRHRAFLRTVGHRLAERGRLRLWLLDVDGQPVAAQLCFALEHRLYASYSGYDPRWAWHAVMMFLFRRCIERAIEEGFREFDLGLGHDQEKLRWGGQSRPVVNLTLASPRLRSRAALALWGWRRRRRARVGQGPAAADLNDPEADSE
jgi:CelD/BcsL family acetyltransferase involved in cellulose biosynthesis